MSYGYNIETDRRFYFDEDEEAEKRAEEIKEIVFGLAKKRIKKARQIGQLLRGDFGGPRRETFLSEINQIRRNNERNGIEAIVIPKDYQERVNDYKHLSSSGKEIIENRVDFITIGKEGEIECLTRNGKTLSLHQEIYIQRVEVPRLECDPGRDFLFMVPVIDPYGCCSFKTNRRYYQ